LGIGDTLRDALIESELVTTPGDLYRLTVSSLERLQVSGVRFGTSRATALVAEIQAHRELTIDEFIGSLGINFLGKRACEIIRGFAPGEFNSIDDWLDPAKLQQFATQVRIPGKVNAIIEGLRAASDTIDDLLAAGVTVRKPQEAAPLASGDTQEGGTASETLPLASFRPCFTGVRMVPTEAQRFRELGGVEKSGVSKNTSHLIVKARGTTSNKAVTALELGIPVMTIEEFRAILADPSLLPKK
jgi:DNA ligase (NAD+)